MAGPIVDDAGRDDRDSAINQHDLQERIAQATIPESSGAGTGSDDSLLLRAMEMRMDARMDAIHARLESHADRVVSQLEERLVPQLEERVVSALGGRIERLETLLARLLESMGPHE